MIQIKLTAVTIYNKNKIINDIKDLVVRRNEKTGRLFNPPVFIFHHCMGLLHSALACP